MGLALAGALLEGGGIAADEPTFEERVAKLAAPLIENEVVGGMAVGVYRDGRRHVFGFGRISAEDERTPDGRTVFEIGSITKVFTAILLAERAEAGVLELDDPVQKHLPEGVTLPQFEDRPIALADLATHFSGLPRMPDNFAPADPANPYADYDERRLFDFLGGYKLARGPEDEWEYSNLAVGLLGTVLVRQAGKTYEALLKEKVLDPLGMADTSVALSDDQRKRLAPGHNVDGGPSANWDLDALAGAGGLRSTALDMLTFLEANLDPPDSTLGKAMRAASRPQREVAPGQGQMGLGWSIALDGVSRLHTGETGGYHSLAVYDGRGKVAVVVLANTATSEVDEFGFNVYRLAGGFPLQPHEVRKVIKIDPAVLDRYVGRYQMDPAFALTVTREGDRLYVQCTDQERFRVYPEGESEFFYRVVDARITFVAGEDGTVPRLILHQNGRDMEAERADTDEESP
jgi:CubicO group peptidase (beta-lactamase class C family)